MNQLNYVIVQAGGKGTRMESLTRNKPKALVPVNNLPMLFHLFRKYPDKHFIVIGDYKYDVLDKYLAKFADVKYEMVRATGHKGTCAGLGEALSYIPEQERFLLIWCDLILPDEYELPDCDDNIIGLSKDFPCRWSYEEGKFLEKPSTEFGVAGHFIFKDKTFLADVPEDGEFVRWLQQKDMAFTVQPLYRTHEYGLYSEWEKLPKLKTRPFNRVEVDDDKLYKIPVDKQGRNLAVREQAWYKAIKETRFRNLPVIYDYDPLCMEFIEGKNIYEYDSIPFAKKVDILKQIVSCLQEVHALGSVPADEESYRVAYLDKTYDRLKKVRYLVPFANDRVVNVNGKACRNIFYCQDQVEKLVMQYMPQEFKFIHGDCTFSNTMLKHDSIPMFIDPRGYFGNTELYGDTAYDWVKVYYSLVSNYDQFNLKRFNLYINEEDEPACFDNRGEKISLPPRSVRLDIASNHWEGLEDFFFELLEGEVTQQQLKLFLAITWLSLTTYAWEDYDSICGAFYNGLYYLEDALAAAEQAPSAASAYDNYFSKNMGYISEALKSIDNAVFEHLMSDCEATVKGGHKIIVSGLGKNVPIGEKFVGTMLSLGLDAGFLHTNSAVHGDMGMIRPGDLVIILTKSGETEESVYLADLLKHRDGVNLWLLSMREDSTLAAAMEKKLIVKLEHEGDLWNVMPNNSTTLNLLILQEVAIELSRRLDLSLEQDFKPNHPGGAIGAALRKGA